MLSFERLSNKPYFDNLSNFVNVAKKLDGKRVDMWMMVCSCLHRELYDCLIDICGLSVSSVLGHQFRAAGLPLLNGP